MKRQFLSVCFKEFPAVPGFSISDIGFSGLGIVDDMRSKDCNLCQPLLRLLDRSQKFMIPICDSLRFSPKLFHRVDTIFLKEQNSFGGGFQVIHFLPPCITSTFPGSQFLLNIDGRSSAHL